MKAAQEVGADAPTTPTGTSQRITPVGWAKSLEMRELRYFHTVVLTGNFGRAARALNVSQPNISQQVLKLERDLGTQLLIRHRRGVTLTRAGFLLMERLDAMFALLSVPLEQALMAEQTTGIIAVALPAESAPLLALKLLEECRRRWPNVKLAIREGTSASLERWVLDRQVDIGVLQDPPPIDEFYNEPIVTERLGLVCDVRTMGSDSAAPIRVRELAGVNLILPEPRHRIRRLIERAVFQRGVVLDQVQQVDGVSMIKEMVRNGLGCTVLPFVAVREEVARGSLYFRPIEHNPLLVTHGITTRNNMAPFVGDIRNVLRDAMTSLVKNGTWVGADIVETSEEGVPS
jgi:LysR family nitrogen assimilation transcriptional regulator